MEFSRRLLLDATVKAALSLALWMPGDLAHAAPQWPPRPRPKPSLRERIAGQLVVIDPGHGGRDPGCIGSGNVFEKDIVLDIAFDLRRALERGGHRVEMTRTRDVFLPLQTRVEIAERHKAALFISVHANSVAANPAIRGASVFTFSKDASDPLAAAIARQENSVERMSDPTFRHVSPEVARILFSLMARSTKIESLLLQKKMVESLARHADMLPHPARHATFAVLQSAAIPSVLVETAFLSNPEDEAALRTYAFRVRIANAMKSAVEAWFQAQKTVFADM
jgi:N-acetylmuramoyl-L-alanine amidase